MISLPQRSAGRGSERIKCFPLVVTAVVWIRKVKGAFREGGAGPAGGGGEREVWAELGTEIDSATSFVNTRLRSVAWSRASGGGPSPPLLLRPTLTDSILVTFGFITYSCSLYEFRQGWKRLSSSA